MEKNIRTIDQLGRIVIPKDIRKSLEISEFDELSISLSDGKIIIEKELPSCTFCHSSENLVKFSGKYVCENCKNSLTKE